MQTLFIAISLSIFFLSSLFILCGYDTVVGKVCGRIEAQVVIGNYSVFVIIVSKQASRKLNEHLVTRQKQSSYHRKTFDIEVIKVTHFIQIGNF
jgi:hypothetical protein